MLHNLSVGGGLPSEGLALPFSQVEVPPDESVDAIRAARPSPNRHGRSVSGPQNKTLIPRLPRSARVGAIRVDRPRSDDGLVVFSHHNVERNSLQTSCRSQILLLAKKLEGELGTPSLPGSRGFHPSPISCRSSVGALSPSLPCSLRTSCQSPISLRISCRSPISLRPSTPGLQRCWRNRGRGKSVANLLSKSNLSLPNHPRRPLQSIPGVVRLLLVTMAFP